MTEPLVVEIRVHDTLHLHTAEEVHLRQFEPLPSDHPVYAVIGRVASHWAKFEYTLDQMIWALEGWRPVEGVSQTSKMRGIEGRIKELKRLCGTLTPAVWRSIEKELDELLLKAKPIGEARHRIVHDPWFMDSRTRDPVQHRLGGKVTLGVNIGMTDVPLDTAAQVVADIERISRDVHVLFLAVAHLLRTGRS